MATIQTTTGSPAARLQLAVMRLAARTGHIRMATRAIGHAFPATTTAQVHLPSGNHLDVALNDPFWCRIAVGLEYEPEVRSTIDQALDARPEALLLDCGANIGYWPAWYAPRTQVIAVEALPEIYERLAENAARVGFTALHRAVWRDSTSVISFSWTSGKETDASAVHGTGEHHAEVATVAIDDLVSEYARAGQPGQPVIVKLDVEGAELAAIEGAVQCRDEILWVYEDHGNEPAHKVTRRFLDLGFRVEHNDGTAQQVIHDARMLDRIKTDQSYGYNFVARHPNGSWA
jgi:FkbM family methyltransferase